MNSAIMSREDKINKGQVRLDDINDYQPLEKPMVETTAKKVNQFKKSLLQENHIDEMIAEWFSLTPNPPKIHKLTPVRRPTEQLSSFVD